MRREHLHLVSSDGKPVLAVVPAAPSQEPIRESFLFSQDANDVTCIHNGRQVSVSEAAIAMSRLCQQVLELLRSQEHVLVRKPRKICAEDDPRDGA